MNILKQISIDKILPNKDYIVLQQEIERYPTSKTPPHLAVMTRDEIEDDLRDMYTSEDEELSWEDLCTLSIENPESLYIIYTGEE